MAKNKKLSLPQAPEFYQDPQLQQGINTLFDTGNRLTNFDFGGNLSPLQDVISFNPNITKLALETAQSQLNPVIRDRQQEIINQLAANNQLESSVTADSLRKFNTDVAGQFQSIVGQAALGDINRALAGRQSLFGTGLNTITSAANLAGQNQSERNQFNLANYQNQVARVIDERPPETGGLFGGLTGAAGGAALGLALAPFTGGSSLLLAGLGAGVGGAAGALGPAGTGGQLFSAGAGAYGNTRSPVAAPVLPGSSAGALSTRGANPFGSPFSFDDYRLTGSLSGGLF